MDEQKRLFMAIILSIVVIAGWNILFVGPETNKQQSQVENTSNSGVENPSTSPAGSAVKDFSPVNGANTNTSADGSTPLTDGSGFSSSQVPANFRDIKISSPIYDINISEKQASVTSLILKMFKEGTQNNSPFKQMIAPELNAGLFSLDLEGKSIQGLDNAIFRADTESTDIYLGDGEKKLSFSWVSPHGIVVEKIYSFSASTYLIGLDIIIKNGSGMPLKDAVEISMPFALTKEGAAFSQFGAYGPEAYINGTLETVAPTDIQENARDNKSDKNRLQGTVEWAGNGDRYFISCIIPLNPVESTIKLSGTDSFVITRYIQSMERVDPGKQIQLSFQCYMGPKSLKVLGEYKNNLKKAINFGWFDILAKPCLIGMNMIHDFIPNYGIAIIILTILIKLAFWPLGTKSYKSMNDMRKLQPIMNQIREKYKDDKQRMNQEVMNLYKTYKVNPMSGCLPMLVQMPIFFALYRMLYQAIELRHAPFIGWINDLSSPDRLFNFDLAIPFMHAPYGIPVLTIIMGASMFLQQKMAPAVGDPTQAKIMMFMPLFMTVIFINFPSGLVLYWLVNNLISIGQQYYIQKKFL
ncbi:MAG: membrane protein insertase YidC [Desulfamplus sp.]|nr:membrane protein insertase YidC [Desulfamplus sp.]